LRRRRREEDEKEGGRGGGEGGGGRRGFICDRKRRMCVQTDEAMPIKHLKTWHAESGGDPRVGGVSAAKFLIREVRYHTTWLADKQSLPVDRK